MKMKTPMEPRMNRERVRERRRLHTELANAERALRSALDGFLLAGMKLRRAFEHYKRTEDSTQRFVEINKDLETQVYGVEHRLTMLIGLLIVLATAFLTSFLLFGVLDAELTNNLGTGIADFFGPYLGSIICIFLALGILAKALQFKNDGGLSSVLAYITVSVVPAYTMYLCHKGIYQASDEDGSAMMFAAALANMALGMLFVHDGKRHWAALVTLAAKARHGSLRNALRKARRDTEQLQDLTRTKFSEISTVAGNLRTLIEELREVRGIPQVAMVGQHEARFLDRHIYGEQVLSSTGLIIGNTNGNDPAEFLPLLERLGEEDVWFDVSEEDVPVISRPPMALPQSMPISPTVTSPPADPDSAFEDDDIKGPSINNPQNGQVHPADRMI